MEFIGWAIFMFSDEEINNTAPIDLVYLWCDGQDPAFKSERQARLKDLNLPWNEDNLGSLRYFDNEELRYSLRSVWKNLPWINHIYIITNNQKPTWLAEHPKVTVVDHSEIMPQSLLPCFNSVTIEMYVHKIPGLAEKYLLANDDVFFGSSLEPSFFFRDDLPIVRLRKWEITDSIEHCKKLLASEKISDFAKTQLRAWLLVAQKHPVDHPYRLSHSVDAFKKTMTEQVLKTYPELLEQNVNPFRTDRDIQRVLIQMEMAFGLGAPLRIVRNPNFFEKYIFWPKCKQFECFGGCESNKLRQRLLRFNPKLFYINSALKIDKENKEATRQFLEKRFPQTSPFEK